MTAAAPPQQPQLPYIETASGNRVSRTSVLFAPQRIAFDGKTTIHAGVQLRGDLGNPNQNFETESEFHCLEMFVVARISIGQWSHVDANALLRPCHKVGADGKPTHFPLNIGSCKENEEIFNSRQWQGLSLKSLWLERILSLLLQLSVLMWKLAKMYKSVQVRNKRKLRPTCPERDSLFFFRSGNDAFSKIAVKLPMAQCKIVQHWFKYTRSTGAPPLQFGWWYGCSSTCCHGWCSWSDCRLLERIICISTRERIPRALCVVCESMKRQSNWHEHHSSYS